MQTEKSQVASGESPTNVSRHLVITVHGIRTFGQWQDRLATLIEKEGVAKIEMRKYHYGYFSAIAFLVPILRWLATRKLRKALLAECAGKNWQRIDIVSHSFGTHMVAWALRSIKPESRPTIHTLILAGSVLKPTFPWGELMPKYVNRVVNECGIGDRVLIFSQLMVLLTGMAGRVGFNATMEGKQFRNRYFNLGHSGYFLAQDGTPQDEFMQTYWLPILTANAPVPHIDERKPLTMLRGAFQVLLKHSEPIKLGVYALIAFVFISWLYTQKHNALVARDLANRRLASANWQVAQDSRDSSSIKSTHYFLRSAEILSSIGDKSDCRDAVLAAQYESALLNHSWVQESPVLGCAFSPDGSRIVSWNSDG